MYRWTASFFFILKGLETNHHSEGSSISASTVRLAGCNSCHPDKSPKDIESIWYVSDELKPITTKAGILRYHQPTIDWMGPCFAGFDLLYRSEPLGLNLPSARSFISMERNWPWMWERQTYVRNFVSGWNLAVCGICMYVCVYIYIYVYVCVFYYSFIYLNMCLFVYLFIYLLIMYEICLWLQFLAVCGICTYVYIWSRPPSLQPPPPPQWVGSPCSSPNSLLFASYWQHFWGPASYLLGLCSISDYQPRIY